jgi:hypothetical protein
MTNGYYGIIAWDSPKGGDWRRLWESPTYKTERMAREAVMSELARTEYPYKGTTVVLHYKGDS